MTQVNHKTDPFNRRDRYEALMDVVRTRMTNRAFAAHDIPTEHFELILEAARHGPSGANCQPWAHRDSMESWCGTSKFHSS